MIETTNLKLTAEPSTTCPFVGLGVQADGVFYHEECRRLFNLTEADVELFERRVRQLRPAITRTFVDTRWFNPECDSQTFVWNTAEYVHLVRLLRLIDELGGRQNLVCFQPTDTAGPELPRLIDAMAGLIDHLRREEGIASVHWLTLFNEPDSFVPHESPLSRRLFGARLDSANKTWADYVAASRYAVKLFQHRGLAPELRLATPDCVWGHPLRRERLALAVRDLADLEVDFAYHNYNPEWLDFYAGNPDFDYPGVRAEARLFRDLVGTDRQLVCWEFNGAGKHFGHAYPGVGRFGEDMLGSVPHAAELTDKMFAALSEGVDGMCLWCIADGPYWPWVKEPIMEFGLYRWKRLGWEPKPYWYYYTALCNQLRPGRARLRFEGLRSEGLVNAFALGGDNRVTVALINKTPVPQATTVGLLSPASQATVLRVYPGVFPTADLGPRQPAEPLPLTDPTTAALTLQPYELAILESTVAG